MPTKTTAQCKCPSHNDGCLPGCPVDVMAKATKPGAWYCNTTRAFVESIIARSRGLLVEGSFQDDPNIKPELANMATGGYGDISLYRKANPPKTAKKK